MFQKLRLWLAGNDASGLREAAREGAREAVREGTIEGVKLGIEDALTELSGLIESPPDPIKIEAKAERPTSNGKPRRRTVSRSS